MPNMTTRQLQVIGELMHNGSSNKQIAYVLGLKEATVKVHLRNIMKRLKVHNRVQIVVRMNTMQPPAPEVRPVRDTGCW